MIGTQCVKLESSDQSVSLQYSLICCGVHTDKICECLHFATGCHKNMNGWYLNYT